MSSHRGKKQRQEMKDWGSFLSLKPEQIAVPLRTERVVELLSSLGRGQWFSSDRPDLCNPDIKVAVEIMEVDETSRPGRKKMYDPQRSSDREVYKKVVDFLKETGIEIDDADIYINSDPALREEPFEGELQSYRFYAANFDRVVSDHSRKVHTYRENHQGHDLVFFIKDVSERFSVEPSGDSHEYFRDKRFVDAAAKSGADYVIWYAPYKNDLYSQDLPEAVVFDVKTLPYWVKTIGYGQVMQEHPHG